MNQEKPSNLWPALERLAVLIFSVIFLLVGMKLCPYNPTDSVQEQCETAVVRQILNDYEEPGREGEAPTLHIIFSGKLTSGAQKGNLVKIEQTISSVVLPKPEPVRKGDRIFIYDAHQMGLETECQWIYGGQNRIPGMILLAGFFLLMVILIGRWKGVATVLSLIITFLAMFRLYIPAVLMGRNIYLTTIAVSFFVIVSSLGLLHGLNRKMLCSALGNFGGVLVAGALALLVNHGLKITGLLDTEYTFLTMLSSDVSIDLRAVVWGGILIGSLGAIMDVSVSISSAMYELSFEISRENKGRLIAAGMNIGRDSIGTMSNTLILAYLGGSMAFVLLFTAYNRNPLIMLNFEMIVVEVVQAIVGSMGILVAVPITVLAAAALFRGKKKHSIQDKYYSEKI